MRSPNGFHFLHTPFLSIIHHFFYFYQLQVVPLLPSWVELTISAAPGKVLYLGAAADTTVSRLGHCRVEGAVYAVQFSHRPGREHFEASRQMRTNVSPLSKTPGIAQIPHAYRYGRCCIFADVAQLIKRVSHSMRRAFSEWWSRRDCHQGWCIDSTAAPEAVFRRVGKVAGGLWWNN
jgi:fibrillarin-like rRNA methylase